MKRVLLSVLLASVCFFTTDAFGQNARRESVNRNRNVPAAAPAESEQSETDADNQVQKEDGDEESLEQEESLDAAIQKGKKNGVLSEAEKEKLRKSISVRPDGTILVGKTPVSAKTKSGLNELEKCLQKHLPQGPKYFPDDMITDQPERILCAEIIREKALRHLRDEVPHGIGVEMIKIDVRSDKLTEINATIYCEREAHKGIIIGKNGSMLQTIGTEARLDIEKLMDTHINLKLWVKIRPDWRNNAGDLRNLGYDI